MKYTILINQLKWQEYFPDADFRHAIVLEIIKSLCNSQSDKIMRSSDGYTWISNNLIIKEAPMLQYKSKAGLSPILNKLCKWELIKIRKDKSNNNYYKITEKAEMLDRKIEDNEHPLEIANGGVSDCKRPRKESLTYNTTNYKTTNINNNNGKFIKPTIQEITTYCQERNNAIDANQFFDFYESKGWMVGKNKMKDWKAAIRTWERNNKTDAWGNPKESGVKYDENGIPEFSEAG